MEVCFGKVERRCFGLNLLGTENDGDCCRPFSSRARFILVLFRSTSSPAETCEPCAFRALAAGFNMYIIALDIDWIDDVTGRTNDGNLLDVRQRLTWSASRNGPMASHFFRSSTQFHGACLESPTQRNQRGCQGHSRPPAQLQPSFLLA